LSFNKNYRIPAIDYMDNLKPYTIVSSYNLRPAQYGCTLSHINALYIFLNNKEDTNPYCFISEDDCYTLYCPYWEKKHYDLFTDKSIEILQMCTTSNTYNDRNLNTENKSSSCTAFYMIKRSIAEKIVNTFLVAPNVINFDNSKHIPITDNLIWKFGDTKLIPMISLSSIDVNYSDISPNINKYDNEHWENYFKGAITKYFNFWKNI
jgi:GR25 family glycosyltransferase involved in LPS biosynthesis